MRLYICVYRGMKMTEIVPNGTWVLLYRPWQDTRRWDCVGMVKSYDANDATYQISNENNNLKSKMRFNLDFVVPEIGVRVMHITNSYAPATITRILKVEISETGCNICLDVRYADTQRVNSSAYDPEENFLDQFRYVGLNRMEVGSLVKVYPSGRWLNLGTQLLPGAIGKITKNNNVNGLTFYDYYEVEMQESHKEIKVRVNEAMPYTADMEENGVVVVSEPKKIPDAVLTLRDDTGGVVNEEGLYWCNDKGEVRKMKDDDWKLQECVVCLTTDEVLVAFDPCGHRCMCQGCFNKLKEKKCPLCRCKIEETLKVYAKQYRINL